MAGAVIGALRVVLGAETAAFEEGLRQAEGRLSKFATGMSRMAAGIAASMAGIGAAVGAALKGAIDRADEMSKAAQKIGVPIEALSGLRYAADLAGVSFETLTSSLGRLARSMSDAVANAESTAGRAFAALGVAVTDATGQMRPVIDVLADIANRFSAMPDSANKTALALQLFGRAGADLIPLLNSGASGLREMMDEAQQLGIVIDQRTGSAAERFNDAISKLGLTTSAIGTDLAARFAPILATIAEKMVDLRKETTFLRDVTDGLAFIFKVAATAAVALGNFIADITAGIRALINAALALRNMDLSAAFDALRQGGADIASHFATAKDMVHALWTEMQKGAEVASSWQTTVTPAFSAMPAGDEQSEDRLERMRQRVEIQRQLNELTASSNALLREGAIVTASLLTPNEQLAASLQRISELQQHLAISAETAQRAQVRAVAIAADSYLGLAGQIAGAVQQIFGRSKAAAIAAAIINTAQAVTKTLAEYGATPWGLAAAAAAAAAGAAQLATIRSTNIGSGSDIRRPSAARPNQASTVPLGGGSGGAPTTVFLQPSMPSQLFSRDQLRVLIEQLNAAFKDGYRLVVA